VTWVSSVSRRVPEVVRDSLLMTVDLETGLGEKVSVG
jgi:hypothetical protein